MLDFLVRRYNSSIVANADLTNPCSHNINWSDNSYFPWFIPHTCITGSVPPVKLLPYDINVTNYNEQLHFLNGQMVISSIRAVEHMGYSIKLPVGKILIDIKLLTLNMILELVLLKTYLSTYDYLRHKKM